MDIGRRQRASASDFDRVYQLLVDASAWLRARGLRQWTRVYPAERFAQEVGAGLVWYWSVDDGPIATATLYESRPEYYPPGTWEDSTAVWYLCRLAIARPFAGQRVGELALASIERDAVAAGVERLRLDADLSNPFLEDYYVRQGFQRHLVVEIFGERALLLEKRLPTSNEP